MYSNRKVKRIYVYLNSPKDLSEIVDFDKYGKRIRSAKYSASYNTRTRKLKSIDEVKLYNYDPSGRLISIKDSLGTDSTLYYYREDGKIDSSIKNLGNFRFTSDYFYNPLRVTTKRQKDSLIVYEKTREFELGFYVKRFHGYYYESKLKTDSTIINGELQRWSYSDPSDLQRFEDDKTLTNTFDPNGRLVKSQIKSVFMNDRINEYELRYKYYKNGLLKSVFGYVPRYFKYEYWE